MEKVRESASNEKMYKCPQCSVMIPYETRDLSICMKCVAGSNFKQRPMTDFEKRFEKM